MSAVRPGGRDAAPADAPSLQDHHPPVTFFTRSEDIAAIMRNDRTLRNMGTDVRVEDYERAPPDERIHFQLNPPEHTEVRRLLLTAVAPPVVQRVVPRIEALGDEVVQRFTANGRADLVAEWRRCFPGSRPPTCSAFPRRTRRRSTPGWSLSSPLCPGAHRARLETDIALNSLLDHTRNMRLAPDLTYDKVWFYLLDRPKKVLVEFDPVD